MASTYELIASVTVGAGGASSMDFTSIPSTYTDLVVKLSGRTNRAANGDDIGIKINGSTASIDGRRLFGTGSNAYSGGSMANYIGILDGGSDTASTFANAELYFTNYAGSNYKAFSSDAVSENNATQAFANMSAILYSSSSAISSLSFYSLNSASWVQYSTAYLYGVKSS